MVKINASRLRRIALALGSALLMGLALPNEAFRFGSVPLGFISLVPLYLALLEAPSYGTAALLCGLFGALQHAITSYWLWFFNDFRFWTLGTTTIAYWAVYAVLGLYLALFLKESGRLRPLAFALLWAAFEYLKSVGFLGYPWGLLPYSLSDCLLLIQIADLTGPYGISFVLALANAAAAELLLALPRGLRRRAPSAPGRACSRPSLAPRLAWGYAAAALCLVALLAAYGALRLSRPVPRVGSLRALLVQQNVDPWEVGEERTLATVLRLAREGLETAAASGAAKPDLILFSETTLQRPYLDFRKYYAQRPRSDPLIPFITGTGSWLFTGAPIVLDWATNEATNSVILIDPEGRQVASYAKVHPVPFAEAIPFWDVPAFKSFIQETVGLESGWVMGKEFTVFELPTASGPLRFGAPICFEDAFSDVCRRYFEGGADLLVNLTNDSWSRTVSAEIQHWAVARFRSIEFRRTMIRSTNGGLSCVIGPYGELIDQLPLFEATSKLVEAPIYKEAEPSFYARAGDCFALGALLLSVLHALILIARGPWRRASIGRPLEEAP
ncbi:MAG TPA: apolipoprotein N-acyltransferase [Spirochaetia bacterium]|nr:apolipoprotein N-acyltransferase [Spirochaetia bacterium]